MNDHQANRYIQRIARRLRGSKGLNGLDLALIQEIKPIRSSPGFYVELGANDGISQSNTYLLQKKYKWGGLLIEPSPTSFIKCLQNRNFGNTPKIFCAACVPPTYKERFIEIEESNLMSTCKKLQLSDEEAVAQANKGVSFLDDPRQRIIYGALAKTLTDILIETESPGLIDLLSLDVEGNELSVLEGIDFNLFAFKWILAEVRKVPSVNDSIFSFMTDAGFISQKILSENESYRDVLFKNTAMGL